MKGINAIENTNDPGKDGAAGVNSYFGKDLTAFSLSYFNGDYAPINASAPMASVNNASHAATNSSQLFNGNIRYMQTRLTNPNTGAAMPMLNAYKYDQLNRLLESRSYENSLSSHEWNPIGYNNQYFNRFSYDAMGNILTQQRHKSDGTLIEDMRYKYHYLDPTTKTKLKSNRLYHIYEPLSLSSLDPSDIDNMGAYDSTAVNINVTNNYSYDEEGRLIKDKAEFISKIVWRVDGKVKEIQRNGGSAKWMKFDYDAMGHRIAKHVYNTAGTVLEKSTYYILDAQGNQVSMYEHVVENETVKYNLVENNIYGSSRLGSLNRKINVLTTSLAANYTQKLGAKSYELNNHLGNVLTVFTDLKIPQDTDNNGSIDAYKIQVLNTFDYSPFGVELDERTQKYVPPAPPAQTAVTVYKNSFDSPQATSNPYTGTPSNLDPNLSTTGWSRPSGTFTNFNGISGTRAIAFENTSADTSYVTLNLSVDEAKLLDIASFSFYHRSSPTGYNAYKLVINGIEVGSGSIFVSSGNTLQHTGTINVANAVSGLSGNVTVTLKLFGGLKGALGTFRMDDFVLNGYTTASENWSPAGYRYGFNGMESDPEFKGQGNSYTTEFRQYDARVGRWLSLDPLKEKFVAFNPFNFNLNNPLIFNDIKGDRPLPVNEKYNGFSWNIASGFGSRNVKGNANASKFHQGADLNTTGGGCTDFGAPVLATHDGIISKVHESTAGGAGRYVEITSPDGSFVTKYFHLSSTNVVVGQKVEEGKQIGQVGASAFGSEKGTACHLHYELKLIVKGVQVPFDVQMDSDTDANTNNNIKNLIDPQLWVNGTFKVGTQELVKIQEIPEVTVRPKEKLELKLRPIELIPIEKRELEPIKNK